VIKKSFGQVVGIIDPQDRIGAVSAPNMIHDFPLENTKQPGSFGSLTGVLVHTTQARKKSFLHDFFGRLNIPQSRQSVPV
jgi:hypothetical protein